MGKSKSDKIAARCWRRWYDHDFTWEGLRHEEHRGWVVSNGLLREEKTGRVYGQPEPDQAAPVDGQSATLQDYWRADPATGRIRSDEEMGSELIVAEGEETYHVIHLPLSYRGKPRLKIGSYGFLRKQGGPAINSKLTVDETIALIRPRLHASSTGTNYWVERRARLDGAVLHYPTELCEQLNVSFEGAAFLGFVDFYKCEFSSAANFEEASFFGGASFDEAKFLNGCNFSRSTFIVEASFRSAVFSDGADNDFRSTEFNCDANFSQVHFSGEADFTRAQFQQEALFCDSVFKRSSSLGAKFFLMPDFMGSNLHPSVSFYGLSARALELFLFRLHLIAVLPLLALVIAFILVFYPSLVHGVFAQDLVSEFGRGNRLVGSVLVMGMAYAIFNLAVFSGRDFFPTAARFGENGPMKEAARARALAKISAENRSHLDEAVFFKHQLKAQRLVAGPSVSHRTFPFRLLLLVVVPIFLAMVVLDFMGLLFGNDHLLFQNYNVEDFAYYGRVLLVSILIIVLIFHTLQAVLDTGISICYEAISDYGLSYIRPIAALLVVIFFSAVGLWAWEGNKISAIQSSLRHENLEASKSVAVIDGELFEALGYSISRAFPFGPWGEIEPPIDEMQGRPEMEAGVCAFPARLLAVGDCRPTGIVLDSPLALERHRLFVRVLGLLQSLFTILLVFLFGLAIRRRFQIS